MTRFVATVFCLAMALTSLSAQEIKPKSESDCDSLIDPLDRAKCYLHVEEPEDVKNHHHHPKAYSNFLDSLQNP
jgi:hypothetical protein